MEGQTLLLTTPFFLMSAYSIVDGLDGIPETRPLLIVGNHTLMALDMNYLVHKLLMDKGFLMRGLAHPSVTTDAVNIVKMSDSDDSNPLMEIIWRVFNPRNLHKLYTLFGSVPVSAKNMHRLLSNGERVLLYPGGAVEVTPPVLKRSMK